MKKPPKLACIFLASGYSKRFRENKLLASFGGRPLIDVVFGNFPSERFYQTVVVTRYAFVAVSASGHGFAVVENTEPEDNIARTIRMGLDALSPDLDGCMFSVCDQPLLRAQSIGALVNAFSAAPGSIAALGYHGRRGNPVIFPRALFGDLRALGPNQSGGAVIAANNHLLHLVEVENRRELIDIDYRADLDIFEI